MKNQKKKSEESNGKKVLVGFIALTDMMFTFILWLIKRFLEFCEWSFSMMAKQNKPATKNINKKKKNGKKTKK